MQRAKKLLLCVAVALVTPLPLTAPAVAAAPDWLPELPDSSSLSTSDIAQGTLLTEAGAPAAGSHVTLYAWPGEEALAAMGNGDSFNLQPVAKTVADAHGRWHLRLRSRNDVAALASKHGTVDLEVVATGPAIALTAHGFSRTLTPTAGGPGDLGTVEAVDLRSNGKPAVQGTPAQASATAMEKGCISSQEADYGPRWDIVGQVYTGYGNSGDFQYGAGQSSELGAATSASGTYGSFHSSGSYSRSSSTTIDFPAQTDTHNVYMRTQWDYRKYYVSCVYGVYPAITTNQYYEVRPVSFVGGTSITSAARPTANYCSSYAPGSKFTKNSTKAITWTNGLNIGSAIGIDLSTQTGYTSTALIAFSFRLQSTLCGVSAYPPNTAYQIVAN